MGTKNVIKCNEDLNKVSKQYSTSIFAKKEQFLY